MGLTNYERKTLVELRLDKARKFIKEAEHLMWSQCYNLPMTFLKQ